MSTQRGGGGLGRRGQNPARGPRGVGGCFLGMGTAFRWCIRKRTWMDMRGSHSRGSATNRCLTCLFLLLILSKGLKGKGSWCGRGSAGLMSGANTEPFPQREGGAGSSLVLSQSPWGGGGVQVEGEGAVRWGGRAVAGERVRRTSGPPTCSGRVSSGPPSWLGSQQFHSPDWALTRMKLSKTHTLSLQSRHSQNRWAGARGPAGPAPLRSPAKRASSPSVLGGT